MNFDKISGMFYQGYRFTLDTQLFISAQEDELSVNKLLDMWVLYHS